jgi:hypothetical protein
MSRDSTDPWASRRLVLACASAARRRCAELQAPRHWHRRRRSLRCSLLRSCCSSKQPWPCSSSVCRRCSPPHLLALQVWSPPSWARSCSGRLCPTPTRALTWRAPRSGSARRTIQMRSARPTMRSSLRMMTRSRRRPGGGGVRSEVRRGGRPCARHLTHPPRCTHSQGLFFQGADGDDCLGY